MVEVVVGELKLVAKRLPPEEALYQRTVFPSEPVVAVNAPVAQTAELLATGAAGIGLIVNVVGMRVVLSQEVVVL